MASYVKFQKFALHLGRGLHHLHAAGDTLKIALSNTAPSAAASVTYTELAASYQVANGNGYLTGGSDVQNDYTESGGTGTLTCVDTIWTATAGGFGPLRYAVMYNASIAYDAALAGASFLVAYWDYGSSITVNAGETFTVDFAASVLTIA